VEEEDTKTKRALAKEVVVASSSYLPAIFLAGWFLITYTASSGITTSLGSINIKL